MNLILVGAGGHARSCLEVLRWLQNFNVLGLLDPNVNPGTVIGGVPVLGDDKRLPEFSVDETRFLCAVGQTGRGEARETLFQSCRDLGFTAATVISPRAVVAEDARVGAGTVVMHLTCANANVIIGDNCIVNTHALVEHDACVGSHTHLSTRATINGGSVIGERCLIGSGAIVLHGIHVCDDAIVGAGAVVARDITSPGTYVGIPARRLS